MVEREVVTEPLDENGATFLLHNGDKLLMTCCDCGLTHDFTIFTKSSCWVTVTGNIKETQEARKK